MIPVVGPDWWVFGLCAVAVMVGAAVQRSTGLGFGLLVSVLIAEFRLHVRPNRINLFIAGFLSGLMSILSGIGAPPMALVYQRSAAGKVRAMMNAFFTIGTVF